MFWRRAGLPRPWDLVAAEWLLKGGGRGASSAVSTSPGPELRRPAHSTTQADECQDEVLIMLHSRAGGPDDVRHKGKVRSPWKPASHGFFYKGHDLSSLGTMEASDNIYVDTARGNQTRPADDILADGGMNGVRLRLWVDPEGGTNGFEYTLALAQRFQAKGQRLYLDFHFTDSWADPQKQPVPAAWPTPDQGVDALAETLRGYVNHTLVAFSEAGVHFDIVSLGNEVRHGILWPLGYVDVDTDDAELAANFTNLATLYTAAREGVDDAKAVTRGRKQPQVMIHVDNGWNLTLQQRWYGALEANGVPRSAWDLFGVSFYPFYGTSATLDNLRSTLGWLAREYKKPVHVAETDYPAICNGQYNPIPESSEPEIPYNVNGQIEWMREVVGVVREVPRGLGRGVWYWEPAWLNNTSLGSACEDAILFRPDYSGWPKTVGYSRPSTDFYLNA